MCLCVCLRKRAEWCTKFDQSTEDGVSSCSDTISNHPCWYTMYYFIYLPSLFILTAVDVYCCVQAFSSHHELRLLSGYGLHPSHRGGFSCWRAQALEHTGSAVVARGLSCPMHVGSSWTRDQNHVPWTGRQNSNHLELNDHWAEVHQGSPQCTIFYRIFSWEKITMELLNNQLCLPKFNYFCFINSQIILTWGTQWLMKEHSCNNSKIHWIDWIQTY